METHDSLPGAAGSHPDRIVLADATDQRRALAVQELTAAGFVVEAFADPADAWRSLRQAPARLAILEVKAPSLTGLEVLSRLRSGRVAPRTPVILITSGMRQEDVDAGLALGATDFLVKPFSAREITLRVDTVLRRMTNVQNAIPEIAPLDEYLPRHSSTPVVVGR